MAEDRQLRAVVALAQAMAAAHTPRESWRAAALGACQALAGSFAALSVWERERGRLRVLVNAGERAPDEEEFPESETYPVNRFPEITEFLHERWAGGGEPDAWVESADGPLLPEQGEEREPGPPGGDGGKVGAGGDSRSGDTASGALWPGHELSADPFAPAGSAAREPQEPTAPAAAGADRQPLSRGYRHPSLPPGPTGPQARVAALRRRRRGCCVVAPIVLHGRAWGELYVARPLGAPVFGREDADFATVLASVIASGIAQTERLEEVRRLAFTDPLTGLANRRAVDARLDEALERHRDDGCVVSLVVCDLNGLKQVNDTHGHAVGDRLLERFGSVLSLCGAMLPGALAARLGGDEFCLVSVGPTSDEVVRVADELCVRAAEMDLGEGVACGVASTGDPIGQVRSARRLFRLADAAQYRAKAARSAKPVVAGRDGTVLQLADTPPRPQHQQERRRFRGVAPEDAAEPWSEP
ncbi:diguanylate cyclase [Streptomyces sp. NPDC005963]|uniref:GGDEF domain-containing protein n=1 Tax=Streptomyces sp. NPDC005963 TaxID=3156721 RepID=UPI0033C47EC5